MLNQQTLKSLLSYDEHTGLFKWLVTNCKGVPKGTTAGSLHKHGYIHIQINKKIYKAHRLAWLYVYGHFPLKQIDHKNHIRSDNRIENLRDVTQVENCRNLSQLKKNTSGCLGVYWDKSRNKWVSKIGIKNKRLHLGQFDNKLDAVEAREQANERYKYHKNHGVEVIV